MKEIKEIVAKINNLILDYSEKENRTHRFEFNICVDEDNIFANIRIHTLVSKTWVETTGVSITCNYKELFLERLKKVCLLINGLIEAEKLLLNE